MYKPKLGTQAETANSRVYFWPTKKNKRPFSVSACSKQTEVCRFHFSFAENKRKLPFSVSSVLRKREDMET
jgi:hypothetical protein